MCTKRTMNHGVEHFENNPKDLNKDVHFVPKLVNSCNMNFATKV